MSLNKKSEKLDKYFLAKFKRWVHIKGGKSAAATILDMNRNTIHRLIKEKSGSPQTIEKVKDKIAEDMAQTSKTNF